MLLLLFTLILGCLALRRSAAAGVAKVINDMMQVSQLDRIGRTREALPCNVRGVAISASALPAARSHELHDLLLRMP